MDSRFGFTLFELTVTLAIVVALAAVVIPMTDDSDLDEGTTEVVCAVDGLRSATLRYHADTGNLPTEHSSSPGEEKHTLAHAMEVPGWNGPYITHPLSTADNPFGGETAIFDDLGAAVRGGFDLMGTGRNDTTGPGCFVRFESVPEDRARLINDRLDTNMPGDWTHTGRVQFSDGTLDVFLFDTTSK